MFCVIVLVPPAIESIPILLFTSWKKCRGRIQIIEICCLRLSKSTSRASLTYANVNKAVLDD